MDGTDKRKDMTMKNVALITVLVSGVIFSATAQDRSHRQVKDAAEIAKQRTERLTNQLGLSEDQQQEVYALNLENAEQMKAAREARAARMVELKKAREEKVEAMRTQRRAEHERLTNILTEEQREKLAQDRSERMQKRNEMRSHRNEGKVKRERFKRGKRTFHKSVEPAHSAESLPIEK